MREKLSIALILLLVVTGCRNSGVYTETEELPPIYPDYTGITIPCNIAPLNFLLRNTPEAVEVKLKGDTKELLIRDSYKVQFAERPWRNLLEAEKGNKITVQIKAKTKTGWIQYAPFEWLVAADPIDPYLSYRLTEPGYEVWNDIQLVERNLESFGERVVADNNLTDRSCMNCHIYGNQDPDLSLFHIPGEKGGMILNRNSSLRKLTTKTGNMISPAAYGGIHPTGRYGVFSTNTIVPAFHTYKSKRLEIYNEASELIVIDFDNNKVIPFPANDSIEQQPFRTFPVFSADGNAVYYCEAPYVKLPDSARYLMYSLHKIVFDPIIGSFGHRVDTVFSASETGYSVCHPKPSPDGNYLMFTIANYGTFPIWHRESDMQMIHLPTREINDLQQVNADYSDSYHSWSSSSRWFVFSSKRDDGVYGKPYFSYIDSLGIAHKPFVLPQSDPARYDYSLKSYTIPELSKGKLPFDAKDIEEIYHTVDAEALTF